MKFANKTSYAVAMLLSTGAAVKLERMPRRLDTTLAAFADQTWDFADSVDFINDIGSKGYLIDHHLIADAPDMMGGMRDFANEKDGGKSSNVMPVATELGLNNLMFQPEDLKQPEDLEKEAGPKEAVDAPEAEIALQIDYLQRQHDDHLMQIEFESSDDA